MKRGTPEHPKTLDLAEGVHAYLVTAGVKLPFEMAHTLTCGVIERLWHYAARYAPSGLVATSPDLSDQNSRRVVRAVGWSFEPEWLMREMVRIGFIDDIPDVGLYIHDWHDHSDDAADKWLSDKGLTYANGSPPRRKQKPVATSHDKSRQVRKSRDKSRQSSSSSESSSSLSPLRGKERERLISLAAEQDCHEAKQCVTAALDRGCTPRQVEDATKKCSGKALMTLLKSLQPPSEKLVALAAEESREDKRRRIIAEHKAAGIDREETNRVLVENGFEGVAIPPTNGRSA